MTTERLDDGRATVSVTALNPFIRMLEEEGEAALLAALARAEAAAAHWGVSLAQLGERSTMRMPHGLAVRLLLDFVEVLGDPSAPLRAASLLQVGDYELLEYLCGSASTLGQSIACLGRYYPLLISAEHELVVDGDRAEARFRITPGLAAPDCIHEFGLASNMAMTILHLSLDGIQLPYEVRFAHPAPPYAELFQEIFLAPARFECEHNAIVFPTSLLAHPLHTADPVLHSVLTRLADQELAALSDQSAFAVKVREAIAKELPAGAALEAVAKHLYMSPSTLRSRLRQHGTSYSDLLDHYRRELSKRALRQSHKSVAEVASELGFSHPPAFVRAFRRWFGVTPGEFREAPSTHPVQRFWQRPR